MNELNLKDVIQYVENNIGTFHTKRLQSLEKLKLTSVLKRKNPYLYKAKNVLTADEIVKDILDAHISSSEETIFGEWLEGLAIFINRKTYNGYKSGIVGIDLEFNNDNKRYIVAIKSGPNWGNSLQISKMKDSFKTAKKIIRTNNSQIEVVAVNGCCYGRDNNPDKGDYFKYCGQTFWEFISGNKNLYIDIIEPLGWKAKEKNEEYLILYSQLRNKFTGKFLSDFCNSKSDIDWEKLIQFNSSQEKLKNNK